MSPIRMERFESGLRLILQFNEAFNRHDVAAIMQMMSDNCVLGNSSPAPDGAVYSGREAITRFWQDFFAASPQVKSEIEEVFGMGERCIMLRKHQWVNAAGENQHVRGIDVFRVRNGLIFEKLSYVKG